MACKTSFELYHNFPKLAEESGFTFNTHRPRVRLEWNKIKLVDIEGLVRERKFALIEKHVHDILDCVLESEFDVRILDEGFLKIFRLAQLAVEYHQFCRHYLDRSVYVLREEVTALAQELEATKRVLKEREEEVRKLRKRSKSAFRTPLPYGNENIATMILKTLSNKSDIFPTLASTETLQHNKCTYCDKVFLNQLYLQSHMSRRHSNISEIPQKDINNSQFERSHEENVKLNIELTELRSKVADMEELVTNFKNIASFDSKNSNNTKTKCDPGISKEMKDAEVSTNGEEYLLDKIKEWKKEEQDKYNKELNLLRTQIISMLDTFKEKEKETTAKNDSNIMNELHATIKQQGLEILALKQELTNSVLITKKSSPHPDEIAQKKEIEAQMSYWVKRAEQQSNEYKLLLQKLEAVAQEAEKSRAEAEIEKMRVLQLQNLLQEKNESAKNHDNNKDNVLEPTTSEITTIEPTVVINKPKSNLIRHSVSIKKLQQKAQELLDITSTSDNSELSNEKLRKTQKMIKDIEKKETKHKSNSIIEAYHDKAKMKKSLRIKETQNHKNGKLQKDKNKVRKKENLHPKKGNGTILPGSPMKIIRAKITEEVNNRLVTLGVDPLKTRLPENIFNRQKQQLREQQQIKFKKYPGREETFHALLTRLDRNVNTINTAQKGINHNSPPKSTKPFSLSSVISNVKTKALSLVKTNDNNKHDPKPYDSVAKKAIMLLRTPSSSANSSPKIQAKDNSPMRSIESQYSTEKKGNITKTKIRTKSVHAQGNIKNYESDSDSTINENSEHGYYINHPDRSSTTIQDLMKSPTRRPSDKTDQNYTLNTENINVITPSASKTILEVRNNNFGTSVTNENNSDDMGSMQQTPRKAYSEENITKLTKGVLKNASSTAALNKKKVIFDMDAIQMKSVSMSSPSQSIIEKSDTMEKYGLGLVNLDNEEWDISSIENEPTGRNPPIARTSPKIAELRDTIASQMTRRNTTKSATLVGGVDVLSAPLLNHPTISGKSGSNTSLGSSVLDDTDSTPAQNHVAFVKPRTFFEKDDSEIDISEFVTDELLPKTTLKT